MGVNNLNPRKIPGPKINPPKFSCKILQRIKSNDIRRRRLNFCGCSLVVPCLSSSLKLAAGIHTLIAMGGKVIVK